MIKLLIIGGSGYFGSKLLNNIKFDFKNISRSKTTLKNYIKNFLNRFKKKENPKLIFIHIPKNAGSSMHRIIKDKLHNYIDYVGHSAPLEYLQATNNFIILREPLTRFCSAFYYRINFCIIVREFLRSKTWYLSVIFF